MLFNSFEFLLFFLIVFTLYYSPLLRGKQVVLLILASFIFYSSGAAMLTLLLLGSICVNSITSFLVFKAENRKTKISLAVAGVVCNVLLLAIFKYAGLLTQTFQQLAHAQNSSLTNVLLHIPLPIGISFYTFEGISLLVDTFKGKAQPHSVSDHIKRTSLFMSFFPHLIAGPILRAREFYPQIQEKYFRDIQWERAIYFLVVGFFFKMFVADNLNMVSKWLVIPNFQNSSAMGSVVSLIAFSFQIFADFAGYSFIAVGLGFLLGYDLPVNFKAPYIARSLREFWQNWHITLSTWIRDYLYIPLGGNRGPFWLVCFNLVVVMTLAGLWHGAEWGFALWGLFHGAGLCVERFLTLIKTRFERGTAIAEKPSGATPVYATPVYATTVKATTADAPTTDLSKPDATADVDAHAARNAVPSTNAIPPKHPVPATDSNATNRWNAWSPLQAIFVFCFVTFAWLLFKIPNSAHLDAFVASFISGLQRPLEFNRVVLTAIFGFPVVLYHLLKIPAFGPVAPGKPPTQVGEALLMKLGPKPATILTGIIYGIMLSLTILNAGQPNDFIYFQF